MAVNSFREDEYMENTDKKKILRRLLSYLLDYKLAIVGILICMGITVLITLVTPLLIEEAIDHYIAKSDIKGLIMLGIFALILNIIFIILVKVRMYGMSVISNKILLNIRQDLYEHIQTLSFSFFDSRPTGKILARIIGDVNSLKDVLTNMVTTLIPEFITVIGVVVIMVIKDWRLALASLSTIPIMVAGIIFVQNMSHKRWQIFRKKSSNLNAYVHEDIAGMNVVQSFGAEDETKETFENLTNEQRQSFVDAVIYADMFGPVIDFCWGIGSMMLYLVGIRFLGFEKVSVGLLVAFGSYINMFWNPIMNLSNFYNNLITNLTAAERIFDILDTKPDIVDGVDVEELGGVDAQQLHGPLQGDAALLGLGEDEGQAQVDAGEAGGSQEDVALAFLLLAYQVGAVVGTDEVHGAVGHIVPQLLDLLLLAKGGVALGVSAVFFHIALIQQQVVGAGL